MNRELTISGKMYSPLSYFPFLQNYYKVSIVDSCNMRHTYIV